MVPKGGRDGGNGLEDPVSELHTVSSGRFSGRQAILMGDWLGWGEFTSAAGLE